MKFKRKKTHLEKNPNDKDNVLLGKLLKIIKPKENKAIIQLDRHN